MILRTCQHSLIISHEIKIRISPQPVVLNHSEGAQATLRIYESVLSLQEDMLTFTGAPDPLPLPEPFLCRPPSFPK